jgi:serine/threonine protein kinase
MSIKNWDNRMFNYLCGTYTNIPPECLNDNVWDEKFDVWSIGCVLYEMMYRCTLFRAQTGRRNYAKAVNSWKIFIQSGELITKLGVNPINVKKYNPDHPLTHLLLKMLNTDPNDRYSCSDLLKDPIFSSQERIKHGIVIPEKKKIVSINLRTFYLLMRRYELSEDVREHSRRLFIASEGIRCLCPDVENCECVKMRTISSIFIANKLSNNDTVIKYKVTKNKIHTWESRVCDYLGYILHF